MTSYYQKLIREIDPQSPNPAGVEGAMRNRHNTLNHLDRATFADEIRRAAQDEMATPGHLRSCALSQGLETDFEDWEASDNPTPPVVYQLISDIEDEQTFETTDPLTVFEIRGYRHAGFLGGAHLRAELRGQPKFAGLHGPMWGGRDAKGRAIIRYEGELYR